jgi:hypothetical protein
LGKASKAAQEWADDEAKATAAARKDSLSAKAAACGGEEWMVNKAIHYNDWVDLTSAEFQPVVDAFGSFLDEVCCGNCNSWLRVTPKRLDAEMLRCDCGQVTLNLKGKK